MKAIRNYTTTLLEFKIAKTRLDYLLLRREELEVRYCGIKGVTYDGLNVQNLPNGRDSMMEFIIALTTPDPITGVSLDDEIEEKSHEVVILYDTLAEMTSSMRKLKDIEAQLYREIVIDGKQVSQAVKHVSEANYMAESNIWHNYYPKIKGELLKLQKSTVKVQ